MKNNGQVKNIDGISNTTSSRRGALDWDIISATHCLTVAPRHFWLPIFHRTTLAEDQYAQFWRVNLWETLFHCMSYFRNMATQN